MNVELIKEYVSLVVEKIRSSKDKSSKFGTKFDLKKFKSLNSQNIMLQYAKEFLQKLGEGSSRAAFLLSSKYALKIAVNKKGLAQNEAELDVYTNPKSRRIVAKIYSYDPDGRWVISDLVKGLSSNEEFTKLTGIDWMDFSEMVNEGIQSGEVDDAYPQFVKDVVETALSNDLIRGDLVQGHTGTLAITSTQLLEHWGKTPGGRVVLLDYGYTRDVMSKHYTSPEPSDDISSSEKTKNSEEKTTNKLLMKKDVGDEETQKRTLRNV